VRKTKKFGDLCSEGGGVMDTKDFRRFWEKKKWKRGKLPFQSFFVFLFFVSLLFFLRNET